MYTQDQIFLDAVNAQTRKVHTRMMVGEALVPCLSIDFSDVRERLIGSFSAKSITVTYDINDYSGSLLNQEMSLYVMVSGSPLEVLVGKFYVDPGDITYDEINSTVTFAAYDKAVEFNKQLENITLPITETQLLDHVRDTMGVTIDRGHVDETNEISFNVINITAGEEYTYRDLIMDYATYKGLSAHINREGVLVFRDPFKVAVDTTIDGEAYTDLKLDKNETIIDSIAYEQEGVTDPVWYNVSGVAGEFTNQITIKDNPLMSLLERGTLEGVVKNIFDSMVKKDPLVGFTYHVFETNQFIGPHYDPMDVVVVRDKNDNEYGSIIHSITWTWNGGLKGTLSGTFAEEAKSDQKLSGTARDIKSIGVKVDRVDGRITSFVQEVDEKFDGVNEIVQENASAIVQTQNSITISVAEIKTDIENIELTPGPKGDTGETGTDGNGITSTEIRYQKSTSGTVTPTGQWLTFIPIVQEKEYLWTRITIKYTTGPDSVSYTIGGVGSQGSKGDTGADGKGIATTVVEYQKSGSGSAVPTGSWSTTLPAVLENEYLWTRTTINYTTGSPSVAYSVGRVGKDGVKGDKGDPGSRGATGAIGPRGEDGTSVLGIVEFYGLSTSDTVKPTSWTEIVSEATPLPKMTSTNKYLWNYEKINFSNGSNQDTVPVIVGVYGDKGSAGIDGRSIVSIKEKYLVTSAASGVTRSTSGWVDTPTATSDTNKYLWNYEIITWNKTPITTYVDPIIIGVHGNKGATGDRGPQGVAGPIGPNGLTTYNWIAYADTASGTGITGNPTGKAYVGYAFGKTSPTPVYSVAQFQTPFQLVKGTDGSPGQPGIPGTPGADGRDNFTWVKYADTPTTGMSDSPTGKVYIGFAYNKPTGTESTTYSDYEWTLSPEFFDEELGNIRTTTVENTANIEVVKDNINSVVGDITTITDSVSELDGVLTSKISENETRIDQVSNGLDVEILNRETENDRILLETAQSISASSTQLEVRFDRVEERVDNNQVTVEEMSTYYRYTEDGAIIGKDGDPMQLTFNNDEIAFQESGQKISYWKGRTFYVENLEVLSTIIIGSHLIEKIEAGQTLVRQV